MQKPNHIFITGASSGLGKALALAYAENGASLYLIGRNEERLLDIAKTCRDRGAKVEFAIIDVTSKKDMAKFIADNPLIDLVIANAGISETMFSNNTGEDSADKVFAVNLNGVLNTIHPLIPLMKQKKKGQIAIVSSLAALAPLPSAPSYSASKAAARFYGEALRGLLAEDGIGVTVICPGFIKTPMTDINKFPMPLIMDAAKAAEIIKKRLRNNPPRIAFPLPLYILILFFSFLPLRLTSYISSKLPKKGV